PPHAVGVSVLDPVAACLSAGMTAAILLFFPIPSSPPEPSEARGRLEGHIPPVIAHALLPGAPAGVHAIGRTLQEGIDLADVALLDLEHLGDLPGMRLHRTCDDVAAIGRLELACLATGVVEEGEREHDAALLVDGHEAAVTDAVHEGHQARLELLGAGPLARIAGGGARSEEQASELQ